MQTHTPGERYCYRKQTVSTYFFVFSPLDSPANCIYQSLTRTNKHSRFTCSHREHQHCSHEGLKTTKKDTTKSFTAVSRVQVERIRNVIDNIFIKIFLLNTILKFILNSISLSTTYTLIYLCYIIFFIINFKNGESKKTVLVFFFLCFFNLGIYHITFCWYFALKSCSYFRVILQVLEFNITYETKGSNIEFMILKRFFFTQLAISCCPNRT